MSNITQVINTDKYLKTLKKGVHASDLDQLLSSTGPYTLFAPSDLAFEKLEKGTIEGLLEPTNKEKLTDLLNNHIVDGKILFNELKDGDKIKTLNGSELKVQVKNGVVNINDAALVARDGKISNGIVHSLDAVIQKN
jgi:uncharacterized surface protein with fasciclin (FAS1) repeats